MKKSYLNAATGSILDRNGASRNVLDGLSDTGPITECDKGNVFILTPGDEIYRGSTFPVHSSGCPKS
jgi:hypothetical protein